MFDSSASGRQASDASSPLPFHEVSMQALTLAQLKALLPATSFSPPQEAVKHTNPRKVDVAQQLARWMEDTLAQEGAILAVVARQGGLQHKKYDRTGMLHTGLVIWHPQEKRWKIYNLIDRPQGRGTRCDVQWTEPVDFFIQQGGRQKEALLMIPDRILQARMRAALLNGDAARLSFTSDYNIISPPHSETSLNCNKWVLLNLLAAQMQTYEPKHLLDVIKREYKPGQIQVHPLARLFAKHQSRVKASEVPWLAPIETVTVQSLCDSGLFEKALFCSASQPEL